MLKPPRRRRAAWLLVPLVAGLVAGPVCAARGSAEWPGRVTHVTDGDSLWILPAARTDRPLEVRLADIDAPEICQAWGVQARDGLKALVGGRTVRVRVVGRDSYGRLLARATVEGRDVGAILVEAGHAWSRRTRAGRGPLLEQERRARSLRRGLHGQPGAVQPRDFRRSHGPCERDGGKTAGLSPAARTP